jgi:hypothetical protein
MCLQHVTYFICFSDVLEELLACFNFKELAELNESNLSFLNFDIPSDSGPIESQNKQLPGARRGHFLNRFPEMRTFGCSGKAFCTVGKLVFPYLLKNNSLMKSIFL